MPKWTEEQQLAIDKENTNIIVSAGAGSGKTAVLTARVIRKLKDNISINQLLILIFRLLVPIIALDFFDFHQKLRLQIQ